MAIAKTDTKRLLRAVTKLAHIYAPFGDPEDLAQNSMLRLLSSKSVPDPIPHSYVYATVRSMAADQRRSDARRPDLPLIDMAVDDNDHWVSVFDLVVCEANHADPFLQRQIGDALRCLSNEHRQALVLSACGYSYGEIANITGVNINTVRSRIHYARRHCRRLLSGAV